MTDSVSRRRLLSGGLTAALASLAGCSSTTPFVGRRIETTAQFPTDDIDTLAVQTSQGDITIRTADRDTIHADVIKQSSAVSADLDELTLQDIRDDRRLKLASQWDGDSSLFGSDPALNLDLRVPEPVGVEQAETSVGSVDVEGTTGDLAVDTSTGSATVRDVDGAVEVSTSTGSIDVRTVSGPVAASASTGTVTVRDPGAIDSISTSTGSVNTDIPAIVGDTQIETSTGSVTARIAPSVDAELTLTSSTGGITVDGVALQDEHREDNERTGRLGDGGPSLTISTSTGGIAVEPLE